jgi:hypothetical protein
MEEAIFNIVGLVGIFLFIMFLILIFSLCWASGVKRIWHEACEDRKSGASNNPWPWYTPEHDEWTSGWEFSNYTKEERLNN